MRRASVSVVVLILVSSLVMAPGLFSQIKVDPASKLDYIQGTVLTIDKKGMTFVVREKGTSNQDYTIVYNDKTKFTYRNGAAILDDMKRDSLVYVIGKADGATKLVAERIDIRQK